MSSQSLQTPSAPCVLQASYAHLSLGFHFDHNGVALQCVDHFFQEAVKTRKGSEHLWEMQKTAQPHPLPNVQKRSQDEWGRALDAMEAAPALAANLSLALSGLQALGSANTDPHLCDFLESHFLNEEVKVTKKWAAT